MNIKFRRSKLPFIIPIIFIFIFLYLDYTNNGRLFDNLRFYEYLLLVFMVFLIIDSASINRFEINKNMLFIYYSFLFIDWRRRKFPIGEIREIKILTGAYFTKIYILYKDHENLKSNRIIFNGFSLKMLNQFLDKLKEHPLIQSDRLTIK